MALMRKRKALGLVEARAWVPPALVDWLISLKAITQAEADDPAELGNVIALMALMQAADACGYDFRDFRYGVTGWPV